MCVWGQWPLEQPVEHYLDQAAHFAEFLSKLYRMRGILLHLRRPAEEDADNNDDDDDAILQPAASSANAEDETVRWWLRELRLTGKFCARFIVNQSAPQFPKSYYSIESYGDPMSNTDCFFFRLRRQGPRGAASCGAV